MESWAKEWLANVRQDIDTIIRAWYDHCDRSVPKFLEPDKPHKLTIFNWDHVSHSVVTESVEVAPRDFDVIGRRYSHPEFLFAEWS